MLNMNGYLRERKQEIGKNYLFIAITLLRFHCHLLFSYTCIGMCVNMWKHDTIAEFINIKIIRSSIYKIMTLVLITKTSFIANLLCDRKMLFSFASGN